jgi:uncharacterized protein (TIGR01777 family)
MEFGVHRMKIVVAGGTGFIGRNLVKVLGESGHHVIVLTRNPGRARNDADPAARLEQWDGRTVGEWRSHVSGADAVINLAGESIEAKRWTRSRKDRIVRSRVEATRALVGAMGLAVSKPRVFLSASAVGYYGSVEDGDVTEGHPKGAGFLSDVCEQWEHEARKAELLGLRVVILRMGVVLGDDGGALEKMILPFKLFVGGPLGSGNQWFPWVHRDDVVGAALFAIENANLSGPVNLSAPESVNMKQFCEALGEVLRRPSWIAVPGLILRLALGEMSEMLLTGQRQIPSVLTNAGYAFRHSKLAPALLSAVRK